MSEAAAGCRGVPPPSEPAGRGPTLALRNRQQTRRLDLRRLRPIVATLLRDLAVTAGDLGVALVDARSMTRINETFLHHAGHTDVITFDYGQQPPQAHTLQGEILVCVDVALEQARRFRVAWQAEVVRYIVHGVLHLRGFDDREPGRRQEMKHEEDRLVKHLAARFEIHRIGV